jgi:hypothetical protein
MASGCAIIQVTGPGWLPDETARGGRERVMAVRLVRQKIHGLWRGAEGVGNVAPGDAVHDGGDGRFGDVGSETHPICPRFSKFMHLH